MDALTFGPKAAYPGCLNMDDLAILYPHKFQLQLTAPPGFNAGYFGRLPLELTYQVLEHVPVQSLVQFRNVSASARYIVDTMPKFVTVMRHAPQMIYGTLLLQPSTFISISILDSKLRQQHCDICPARLLAPYFWIPTATRLCYGCLLNKPTPIEREEMARHKITDSCGLPTFRFPAAVLRGIRPGCGLVERSTSGATLYEMARKDNGILLSGKPSWAQWGVSEHYDWSPKNTPGSYPYHMLYNLQRAPETPNRSRRCIATVVVPWVHENKTETGVFCLTCSNTMRRDMYHRDEFPEHLRICRVQPGHIIGNGGLAALWRDTPYQHYHLPASYVETMIHCEHGSIDR
ncbi:uncharacterized protein BDR25DRAFT_76134 [Lindgomyces ingoldianus]|uniref:Uncharacterized protein n=1 Tax=Lindgomyces ingoldianus TaxID=673940 RepID=A0ACB6QJ43_9PLEO|nr:uncharacterized protein BDR25DRAFT_76134 [Lindgomyces ingoldianus]KAF2466540.1 hypothetical protein BDR25DRAFT_76134 [Lindgomyces ingoldianus]